MRGHRPRRDRHQLTNADDNLDYSAAFTYTRTGKLATAFVQAPTGDGTLTFPRDVIYQYASENPAPGPDDPIDPEIPVALNPQNGSAFDTQLGYDVAGNLTQRTVDGTTYSLRYDGANRLRSRNANQLDEEIYYYHDNARWLAVTRGNGGKLKKVRFWVGNTEIIYLCGKSGCAKDETRTTVGVGGRSYFRIEESAATGTKETKLLHQNGLGHLLGVYSYDDSSGSLVYQLEVGFQYGPYGEILETGSGGGDPADYLQRFNGKELDLATGLSYYGYRYYDPVTLAWNRPDPWHRSAPDASGTNPRLGNLFTFSLNNPMRYVDPDGLETDDQRAPPSDECVSCPTRGHEVITIQGQPPNPELEALRLHIHQRMLLWFAQWNGGQVYYVGDGRYFYGSGLRVSGDDEEYRLTDVALDIVKGLTCDGTVADCAIAVAVTIGTAGVGKLAHVGVRAFKAARATRNAAKAAGVADDAARAAGKAAAAEATASSTSAAKGASDDVIYRLGDRRESPTRLGKKSAEAEAVIGKHGVSGSTTRPPAGTPCSSASCSELESAGFSVHRTPSRRDAGHVTIELPKPVTKEVADAFNTVFGR